MKDRIVIIFGGKRYWLGGGIKEFFGVLEMISILGDGYMMFINVKIY